jgi:hypothetical protein
MQVALSHEAGKQVLDANKKPTVKSPVVLMVPSSVLNPEFQDSMITLVTKRGLDGGLAIGDFLGEGRIFNLDYVPQNSATMSHYAVTVLTDVNRNPIKAPLKEAWVKSWKPWDQLLRKLTEKEQVELLCRYFPADAIEYAFRSSRFVDYVPTRVLGASSNKTAVSMPAGIPAASAPMVSQEDNAWDAPQSAAEEDFKDAGDTFSADTDGVVFGVEPDDAPFDGGVVPPTTMDPQQAASVKEDIAARLHAARNMGKKA